MTKSDLLLLQAELDLRTAQSEFDRQAEITKLLLEGISSTHVSIHCSFIISSSTGMILWFWLVTGGVSSEHGGVDVSFGNDQTILFLLFSPSSVAYLSNLE